MNPGPSASPPTGARLLLLCGLALGSACAGPDPGAGRRGSMEELGEMLSGSSDQKIEWTESDMPPGPLEDGSLPGLLQPNPDYRSHPALPDLLDPAAVDDEEGDEPREGAFSSNPYLLFGPRIVVHPDGMITKVFPLPPGKGEKMLELMAVLSPFPAVVYDGLAGIPADEARDPERVEVVLLRDWDQEPYQALTQHPPPEPTQVKIADWLVVTALEDLLWEVESFVKVFAAGVPQIEIEAKILEVTESDELDYGIRPRVDTPILGLTGESKADTGTLVDSFSYTLPNKTDVAESLINLSTIQDSYTVNAIVEAVKNWENVSINSQPKIAVREGGVASIVNTTDIPFYGFTGITATGGFQATLQNKEVGTKLYVAPRVVADTVAMDINLEVSQQVGTLVSFITETGGELAAPLIARRQAKTVVYLEPGQAVVLGGLTSERTVQEESRVPLLGDIPLLGLLFKSKFMRTETTHVIFIIKPRILQAAELANEF